MPIDFPQKSLRLKCVVGGDVFDEGNICFFIAVNAFHLLQLQVRSRIVRRFGSHFEREKMRTSSKVDSKDSTEKGSTKRAGLVG